MRGLGPTQKAILRIAASGQIYLGPSAKPGPELRPFGYEDIRRSAQALVRRGLLIEGRRDFYRIPDQGELA